MAGRAAAMVGGAGSALAGRRTVAGAEPGVAFEAVFRANYGRLVAILTATSGERELAADLAQQAFVQLWANWSRIGAYENPSGWATKVALNLLRNHRRSLRRRAVALLRLQHLEPAEGARSGTPPAEFGSGLMAALGTLPLRQRMAAVLYYLDDRPVAEIAAVMGVGVGTVNRYLHRSRGTLRSLMEASDELR